MCFHSKQRHELRVFAAGGDAGTGGGHDNFMADPAPSGNSSHFLLTNEKISTIKTYQQNTDKQNSNDNVIHADVTRSIKNSPFKVCFKKLK